MNGKQRRACYAWTAAGGLALFLLVLLDTVVRGPLSWGLVPANDAVSAWRDAGIPVHDAGRLLSMLGDWRVCLPVLLVAGGLCAVTGSWRRGIALFAIGALAPLLVGQMQQILTGLNSPIPGLDPYMVPDTDSGLREGGSHLFPSGHSAHALIDWGFLFLLAVPVVLDAAKVQGRRRAWLQGTAVGAWVLAFVLAGVGRVLRQAHGYNDVLAGYGIGLAIVFGSIWLLDLLWGDEGVRPPAGS